MGKRKSKGGSKKGKSKKSRQNSNEAKFAHEQENLQKSSFDEIAENFLGSNPEQNINSNKKNDKNGTASNIANNTVNNTVNNTESNTTNNNINSTDNISETSACGSTFGTTSIDPCQCYEEIKARQQEIVSNLKNLSDAIGYITLTRDNAASLRVDILSFNYFTRQVRPLIDAVNLIAFASANLSIVAQNLNINTSGDRKEIKNALKLCYKMNDEIDNMLDALTRRIKLYVAGLNNMDKNCQPFSFDKDS